MHTRQPGLIATWKLPIAGRYYARVFVFDTQAAMYAALPHVGQPFTAHAEHGAYSYLVSGEGDKLQLPRKFGELHFFREQISARIVAHEIQHILLYWISANGLDIDQDDEQICEIAGEMTREFWNGYYEFGL